MPRAKEILTLKAPRKRTPCKRTGPPAGRTASYPSTALSDQAELLQDMIYNSGLGQDRFANRIEVAIDRTPPSFTSAFFRKNFMMRDPPVGGISMPAEFKTFWSEGHTQTTSGMAISSIHRRLLASPSIAARGVFCFCATPLTDDLDFTEDSSARRLGNTTERASRHPARIHPPKDIPMLGSSIFRWTNNAGRYRRGHLNAGRADDEYLVWEDLGHSGRQLLRVMATLTPSTVVHPSLDYDSTMALRENESALLFDLHWSQDPFDGATDLPLVNVPAQEFEIGYNRFIPEQLRCANNCSSDWGSLFDDAMRSRNLSRLHLRERQLHFEINRRWPIPAGPHKAEQQTIRLRVWIEVMWFFHMMCCLRFGLCAPAPLTPSPLHIERLPEPVPASKLSQQPHQPRSPVPPASAAPASSAATSSTSSSLSSGPVRYTSRVLPALDAEMERISGRETRTGLPDEYKINEYLLNDPSVIPVAARLERLERRKTKFPVPADSRQPFYLRNPRIAPYPLPVPSRPSQSRNSQEENTRLLNDAMAPQRTTPAVHHSSLGSIPPSTVRPLASSAASSSSQADTATTVPNSPVLNSSPQTASSSNTNTNVLHSHPTDPIEWLSRLGSRSSPGVASHFDILIACLKRVLPNHAVTRSCQFLVDELNSDGIRHAQSNLNALERIANRFREVIAEELRVRRDALRRRESELVSNWEDEYLANAREDKKLAAEVAELLHGRRPSPSPPPSPRHEQPYFVSSARVSGLRAPPTSRIGPVPPQSSHSHSPPPLTSATPSTTCASSSTQRGTPTPPPSELAGEFYDTAEGFPRKRRRVTPAPPPSPVEFCCCPPTGPILWDDAPMTPVDPDEPEVDEDKVIASAFYQDLARDLCVDPSIDRAMVRTLTQLAEGTPDDLLNKCVDSMMEEETS
ncbi:hypothetical protein BDZ89DRAFT_1046349 [Hymenopellis radicata]|nr:hypothetical protein BDZ89DRAFT_1046349 [Hymenopellis radicata]